MKIRKAFQGTVPENKILDTYSTSQTDTYSCNYVNNKTKFKTLWSGNVNAGYVTLNESIQNYDFLIVGIQTNSGRYSKGSEIIPVIDVEYPSDYSGDISRVTYDLAVFQNSSIYSNVQIYFENSTKLVLRSESHSTWTAPGLKYVIGIKL